MTEPVTPAAAPVVEPAGAEPAPEAHVPPEAESTEDSFRPISSQEEFDSALKQRLARAEKSTAKKFEAQIQELTQKITAHENEKLSASEKLIKRAEDAEKVALERDSELTKLKRDKLVADLAHEAGLPKKLWDRVRGDDDDAIAADIQELMETLPKPDPKDGKKPPTQGGTVKLSPTGSDGDAPVTAESIIAQFSPRHR